MQHINNLISDINTYHEFPEDTRNIFLGYLRKNHDFPDLINLFPKLNEKIIRCVTNIVAEKYSLGFDLDAILRGKYKYVEPLIIFIYNKLYCDISTSSNFKSNEVSNLDNINLINDDGLKSNKVTNSDNTSLINDNDLKSNEVINCNKNDIELIELDTDTDTYTDIDTNKYVDMYNKDVYPYPYQQEIINKTITHFENNDRGKLNLFCRLGKTLISYWIADRLGCDKVIILVPSLDLLNQTYLCLKSISCDYEFILIGSTNDKQICDIITTSKKTILNFMKKSKYIIISTYQSATILSNINDIVDMCIFDEAHKTTGILNENVTGFKCLLRDNKLKVNKRLFMTATEKVYSGSNKMTKIDDDLICYSMDDENIYGKTIYSINCNQAMELNAINKYKIITIVGKINIKNNITQEYLSKACSLLNIMQKKGIMHVISFHNRIKNAELFKKTLDKLVFDKNLDINVYTINGNMTITQRKQILEDFQDPNKITIITSAKVLQEGINLPVCDAVIFIDNKTSTVDCVQSISRCLTKFDGKGCSYVIIPLVTKMDDLVKHKDYIILRMILRNLGEYDDNIKAYFRSLSGGYSSKSDDPIIEIFDCDGNIFDTIFDNIFRDIGMRIWTDLKKFAWRNFDDARKYVHELGINSYADWMELGELSNDIPINPDKIYRNMGWKSWNDWFGIVPSKLVADPEIIKELSDNRNRSKKITKAKFDKKKFDKDTLNKDKSANNNLKFKHQIVATYVGQKSLINFNKTVLKGINKSDVINHLNDMYRNILNDVVSIWGYKSNKVIKPLIVGDIIIFVLEKEIYITQITYIIENEDISNKLWRNKIFKFVYFIDILKKIEISSKTFFTNIGYNVSFLYGSIYIKESHLTQKLYDYIYNNEQITLNNDKDNNLEVNEFIEVNIPVDINNEDNEDNNNKPHNDPILDEFGIDAEELRSAETMATMFENEDGLDKARKKKKIRRKKRNIGKKSGASNK